MAILLAMPLLQREADHFPEDVFRLSVADFPWGVAHVKSRTEKALARHLGALRIPFYLPLGERRTRRGGRTFVSYLPFFPGYVFLRGGPESRAAAMRSGVVVRLLDVSDQDLLDRELAEIRALQVSGAPLVVHPYLSPGNAVRIREGPFQGSFWCRRAREGRGAPRRFGLDAEAERRGGARTGCRRNGPGESCRGRAGAAKSTVSRV